ncbi:MAG: AhpC/TSA family protein [Acidobacteriia bacterium]|nr:AhpC/TSA family protein [Terriglobia bacterium]
MKWRGLEEAKSGLGHASLKAALDERRALMEKYVPAETQALNRRAVEEIRGLGIAEWILPVGAAAPEFELPDQDGKQVSSSALLAKGPLVIVFVRGRWCPFCVATVEAWNEALPQVREAGGSLVGISPQTIHQSYLMHEQHKPGFPLLSDTGNAVARKFGLVYRVPPYQQEIHARTFVNLPFINGDSSWELPLPAAYVVGADGTVQCASADADYTMRVEPLEVLKCLSG